MQQVRSRYIDTNLCMCTINQERSSKKWLKVSDTCMSTLNSAAGHSSLPYFALAGLLNASKQCSPPFLVVLLFLGLDFVLGGLRAVANIWPKWSIYCFRHHFLTRFRGSGQIEPFNDTFSDTHDAGDKDRQGPVDLIGVILTRIAGFGTILRHVSLTRRAWKGTDPWWRTVEFW